MGEDFRLRQPPNPLAALDRAIGMVDAKRSYLGAMENRLSAAIDHNAGMVTNLSAAKSRIMDANYALETSRLAKAQIINQAAQSVLAQANAVPETVLALLNS
nr:MULTISPECIES: flagellin [unclassified Idiomarina]